MVIGRYAERATRMGTRRRRNGHLIFKSDGESSIKAVRDRLAGKVGGRIVLEQPAQGESQSDGTVEEAGKTVREFVRLLQDVLESNLQIKIGTREPIMQWTVRWAAMLVTRYLVGKRWSHSPGKETRSTM